MAKQVTTLYKKMVAAHSKYESAIGELERELTSFIEFDFGIFYQPSDGFVMVYEQHNAPLSSCLSIIKSKGKLTIEDYMKNRI